MKTKLLPSLIIFLLSFTLATALIYSNETVGYWDFEENGGSIAFDYSPNLNNGSHSETYNISKGSNGTGDYSIKFEVSGGVVVPNNGNYTFGDGSSDSPFSAGAWIKADDISAFRIAGVRASGTNTEWFFTIDGSDMARVQLHDNDAGGFIGRATSSAYTADEGTWIHWAFTYDGSGLDNGVDIYRNAAAVDDTNLNSGSYTAMEDTDADLEIGSINNETSVSNGLVDEPFIFDYEISQAQIEDIYNNGIALADSTPPIVNSFSINDTSLVCSDTIEFQANVTDNFNIVSVYFNFTDDADRSVLTTNEIGDLYFYRKNYTTGVLGTGIYNVTLVIATDDSNNVNNYAVSEQYNYTCAADIIDPTITPQSGEIIDVTVQDEFNYSAGCFDQNPHNFTLRIHNESDDILYRFNETASIDINLSIKGTLDLTGISLGEYTINHTCIDDSGNTAADSRVLILSNETIEALTLLAPANNSIVRGESVTFSYNIDTAASIDLYINDTLRATMTSVVGDNSFSPISLFENNTDYSWYVNASKGAASLRSGTFYFTTNQTEFPIIPEDEFSIYSCPIDTLPKTLLFMFFIALGIVIFGLGYWVRSGLIGALGGTILLILSLYLFACIAALGIVMSLLSIFMIIFIYTKSTSRSWD